MSQDTGSSQDSQRRQTTGQYRCEECNKSFDSQVELNDHRKTHDQSERPRKTFNE